jgi:hypothetical protein
MQEIFSRPLFTHVWLQWLGKARPRRRETGFNRENIGRLNWGDNLSEWVWSQHRWNHTYWCLYKVERTLATPTNRNAVLLGMDRYSYNDKFDMSFDIEKARPIAIENLRTVACRSMHSTSGCGYMRCSVEACDEKIVSARKPFLVEKQYEGRVCYCRAGHIQTEQRIRNRAQELGRV